MEHGFDKEGMGFNFLESTVTKQMIRKSLPVEPEFYLLAIDQEESSPYHIVVGGFVGAFVKANPDKRHPHTQDE
jgi:hypothetical protein